MLFNPRLPPSPIKLNTPQQVIYFVVQYASLPNLWYFGKWNET